MIGKRAKSSGKTKSSKPVSKWVKGSIIRVNIGNRVRSGKILEMLNPETARVKLDNGKKYRIAIELLKAPKQRDIDCNDEDDEDDSDGGFSQYPINWDIEIVNFSTKIRGIRFNGWWRKRGVNSYAIDIYATLENGKNVSVEGLGYLEDPKDNVKSLNSDICAAINKWFHLNEVAGVTTMQELTNKAKNPVLVIRRLETIDRMILGMKEFRDTAIRCGGTRFFNIKGDGIDLDEPNMGLSINITPQAMALDGKIPSLYDGAVYDGISGKRGARGGSKIVLQPKTENVQALVEMLDRAKKSGDQTESRKIRASLRRMGHRGGGKSFKGKQKK